MVTHSARVDDTTAKRVAVSHADWGIVVSGDPGSGKTTFVELLSAEYGKKVYSVGEYWREKYKKEHPHGDITFEAYWRYRPKMEQLEANFNLRRYVRLGYIIDTRYASIFDELECFIIYLRAPLYVRAVRLATRPEYSGMTIKEREAILAARQEDEVSVGMMLFGVDYRDPNLYDLILDSSLLTPDEELAAAKARMRRLMNLARR